MDELQDIATKLHEIYGTVLTERLLVAVRRNSRRPPQCAKCSAELQLDTEQRWACPNTGENNDGAHTIMQVLSVGPKATSDTREFCGNCGKLVYNVRQQWFHVKTTSRDCGQPAKAIPMPSAATDAKE